MRFVASESCSLYEADSSIISSLDFFTLSRSLRTSSREIAISLLIFSRAAISVLKTKTISSNQKTSV